MYHTSIFCIEAPPSLFFPHLIPAHSSLFKSLYACTPMYYLFGGVLVATSFLFEDPRSQPLSATSCDKILCN